MVIDYVMQHREEFKFAFDFAEEDEPLGTGGAILNALQYSDTQDFFVINGDTFFDVNYDEMSYWQETKMADCTIALKPMQIADRYGLVNMNDESQIVGFEEKKVGASGLINGGVYCIFRNSFLNIPFPQKFSFEKDYLEKMINERDMIGYVSDNYFIDIGIPEDYARAQTEIPALFSI
jgi:D-glycero-alpha-D-manno-heptose 1-phosphate guanylyltransferase